MTQDTPDFLPPAARINPTANLTAPAAGGQPVAQVDDTSGFRVGDSVAITGQSGGGQQTYTGVAIDALTSNSVTFSSNIPQTLNLPGTVVVFPTVIVQPAVGYPGVLVEVVSTPLGTNGERTDGYTWHVQGKFTPTQTPSLSVNRGAGTNCKVGLITCHMMATSTTSQASDLTLAGSVAGTVWEGLIGVPGSVGARNAIDLPQLGFRFSASEAVALTLSQALGTGVYCDMSMAGWDT